MMSLPLVALVALWTVGMLLGAQRWRARRTVGKGVTALTEITALLQRAEDELNAQRAETEAARRRSDEYLAKIEGVVKEAQEAKKAYVQCAVEHGAAQGIMMREIERLAIQYRQLGILYKEKVGTPPPNPEAIISPIVREVAAAFRESHPVG